MDNYKYYNMSLAYDFDMFAESAAPKTEPKAAPGRAKVTRHPASKIKKAEDARRSLKSKVFAVTISIFLISMVFANIFTRAEITKVNSQIDSVNTEISCLESEKTRLNCAIEKMTSYKNVEEAAKQLGMNKIEKGQMVYIKTNAEDCAVDGKGTDISD